MESPTYILNEDTQPVIRAMESYRTQLAKMSFDKIFHLTAGVYFYFIIIVGLYIVVVREGEQDDFGRLC